MAGLRWRVLILQQVRMAVCAGLDGRSARGGLAGRSAREGLAGRSPRGGLAGRSALVKSYPTKGLDGCLCLERLVLQQEWVAGLRRESLVLQ